MCVQIAKYRHTVYCKYYTIHLQRLQSHYFLHLLYGNFAADKYNKNGQKAEKGTG